MGGCSDPAPSPTGSDLPKESSGVTESAFDRILQKLSSTKLSTRTVVSRTQPIPTATHVNIYTVSDVLYSSWTLQYAEMYYRRPGFDCEILLIANCEFFYNSQSKESQEKEYAVTRDHAPFAQMLNMCFQSRSTVDR